MTPALAVARRVLADQSVTRMLGTRLERDQTALRAARTAAAEAAREQLAFLIQG